MVDIDVVGVVEMPETIKIELLLVADMLCPKAMTVVPKAYSLGTR